MSVNKVILVGNVGQNPDIKVFDGGTKKASFSLATSEKYTDKEGTVHENTEWHHIVCWRKAADIVEKFVKKGSQLYVEGKLTTRNWQDQNGQDHYVTEVDAATLQLLGRKDESNQGQVYQAPQQVAYQAPAPAPAAPAAAEPNSFEPQGGDLPF